MFNLLQSQPGGMGSSGLIMMGLIMVVFWLFFIRPQSKKAKDAKNFISDLKEGDKVVTIAGIHGKIQRINEDGTVSLQVSAGSYLIIEKSAISMEMTKTVQKGAAAVPAKA